ETGFLQRSGARRFSTLTAVTDCALVEFEPDVLWLASPETTRHFHLAFLAAMAERLVNAESALAELLGAKSVTLFCKNHRNHENPESAVQGAPAGRGRHDHLARRVDLRAHARLWIDPGPRPHQPRGLRDAAGDPSRHRDLQAAGAGVERRVAARKRRGA